MEGSNKFPQRVVTAPLAERGESDEMRRKYPEYPEYWQGFAGGDANKEIVGIIRLDILDAVESFVVNETEFVMPALNKIIHEWLSSPKVDANDPESMLALMSILQLQDYLIHMMRLVGVLQADRMEGGAILAMRQMQQQKQANSQG